MDEPLDPNRWRRMRRLSLTLLLLWVAVGFGLVYFARDLNAWTFLDWPLGFWVAAQGAVLGFLGIVVGYAWAAGREKKSSSVDASSSGWS